MTKQSSDLRDVSGFHVWKIDAITSSHGRWIASFLAKMGCIDAPILQISINHAAMHKKIAQMLDNCIPGN